MTIITIRSITERHDCAGKKTIVIQADEPDSLYAPAYQMSPYLMLPHDRLVLSTMAPTDQVKVDQEVASGHLLDVVGTITEPLFDWHTRDAVCTCHAHLITDGFDLYCPNPTCSLTIAAQLRRLSETRFYTDELWAYDSVIYPGQSYSVIQDAAWYQPFVSLVEPRFWNRVHTNLETMLTDRKFATVGIENFLVPDQFEQWVEDVYPYTPFQNTVDYRAIVHLFDDLYAIHKTRDGNSPRQHYLLQQFLVSLGIESLTLPTAHHLVSYALSQPQALSAYGCLAFLMSRAEEMIGTLHVHPLEARNIETEMFRRKFSFYDIFSGMSSFDDISYAFDHWTKWM